MFLGTAGVASADTTKGVTVESTMQKISQTNPYMTYVAKPFGDSLVRVTLSNGRFHRTNSGIEILNSNGVIVDKIDNLLVTDNGGKAQLKFTLLGKRTLFIKYDVVENPVSTAEERGYWGCVGKSAVGGALGGAVYGCGAGLLAGGVGCVPGAGAGALQGGVTAGIGSLIWCW